MNRLLAGASTPAILAAVILGHPLYYFVKDKDAGDAYGEGLKNFGAEWYVLAPSGRKVDNDDEHS